MSPIQSLELIGFAPEGTFGTFVAPTQYVPGIPNINTTTKVARPAQARGTRAQVIDVVTGIESQIQITAELIPEVLSRLEAYFMGVGSDAVSGSAGVGFTHVLTPKNAISPVSCEVDHDVSSQVLARQFTGGNVDQIVLRAQNQQVATLEATLLMQREFFPATPNQGVPSNPTPAITTLQPMDFSLLAATYKGGATTQLMDVTLTLQNHVQRIFSNNGKLYVARLVPTLREVQLATTLDFLDTTFYLDWINGIKTSGMVLTMTTPNFIPGTTNPYVVQHTIPGLRPMGQYTLNAASDVLNQQINWSVTQSGANEVSASWINSESGALA